MESIGNLKNICNELEKTVKELNIKEEKYERAIKKTKNQFGKINDLRNTHNTPKTFLGLSLRYIGKNSIRNKF